MVVDAAALPAPADVPTSRRVNANAVHANGAATGTSPVLPVCNHASNPRLNPDTDPPTAAAAGVGVALITGAAAAGAATTATTGVADPGDTTPVADPDRATDACASGTDVEPATPDSRDTDTSDRADWPTESCTLGGVFTAASPAGTAESPRRRDGCALP